MKVVKIGGGCLKGKKVISSILDLVAERGKGDIFVVSALGGVTDMLIDGMADALDDEESIPKLITRLRNKHMLVARHIFEKPDVLRDFNRSLNKFLLRLERYYYGLNFTGEITPKMEDVISSFGERISADLLSSALRSRGVSATCRMPHKIGVITDGKFGDATADLDKTEDNLNRTLKPLMKKTSVLFIPGFFGISEGGDITTFGRGGSDYSAAVVAVTMNAEVLEFWKDVAGYMSADPRIVSSANLIPKLSYEEAAELSYFGAKILHPRAVEPARKRGLKITIKNTLDPDAEGTVIAARSPKTGSVIKSVTQNTDIGILKVYASGVGARPGILADVAGSISESGINIRSVVTSQTCISLLVDTVDLEKGYEALKRIEPRPFRRIEKVQDVALLGIVGEGQNRQKGIAARCFTAMADADVNVEMISFGPSKVALYFIVKAEDLKKAVREIHNTFFSEK